MHRDRVEVARDNAAINHVALGHGAGELLLAAADGMDSALLAARSPFDLLIANILAGLLDSQVQAVIAAYEASGVSLADRGLGQWPVLVLSAPD